MLAISRLAPARQQGDANASLLAGSVEVPVGNETAIPVAASQNPAACQTVHDDLSRQVYCILGVPFDAVSMNAVLGLIESAVGSRKPLLLSAANLNSLVISQSDEHYRETLVHSDLCTADGMPIVWLARMAGIPIKSRIAGSDIFEALKNRAITPPLKVFLFGGQDGVAKTASQVLNGQPNGVNCVGWHYPGFGSAEEMSRDDVIDNINSSGADFLAASLGNQKGQSWLRLNHRRLSVPVRAHLGATINFQAGTVKRAPVAIRKYGLEWLWRIKEEPYLWSRYWNDASALFRLLVTRALMPAICMWWLRLRYGRHEKFQIIREGNERITLRLLGPADARHLDKAVSAFREAIATEKQVALDFSRTRTIDARFLGLLLMLKKTLAQTGRAPVFEGMPPVLERIFRLNGLVQ